MDYAKYHQRFQPYNLPFPDRFYDVGIAEEHAVTLSAGLALGGMRPFTAIYGSFLQRAFDQILEDVSMQNAPVCLLCDRSGIGSHDGSSHHGIFGVSFLSCIPDMTVLSPLNRCELKQQMDWVMMQNKPVAIVYPKSEKEKLSDITTHFEYGRWETVLDGKDATVISYSSLLSQVLDAAKVCAEKGISLRVLNASTVSKIDSKALLENGVPVFVTEENVQSGSLGERLSAYMSSRGMQNKLVLMNAGDNFIPHGSHKDLLRMVGLDSESIAERIVKEVTPQ